MHSPTTMRHILDSFKKFNKIYYAIMSYWKVKVKIDKYIYYQNFMMFRVNYQEKWDIQWRFKSFQNSSKKIGN